LKNIYKRSPLLILSILAGILLSISWPQRGVPMLSFIAFIPLLIAEDYVLENRIKFSKYSMLLYSWLGFIIFNALTTWWIFYASLPGVLMAVLLNSFFMAIPVALMHALRRTLPGNQGQLSLVVLWLAFEYLHLDWELSWSWLNLGNVFSTIPAWVQWYEYTGALGGTAWVLIMNICLYNLLRTYTTPVQQIRVERTSHTEDPDETKRVEIYLKNRQQYLILKKRAAMGLFCLGFLIIPSAISFWIGRNYVIKEDPVEVIIVQPARDPWVKPSGSLQEREWIDDLIKLANNQISPKTRFIVAPEVAIPGGIWIHNKERDYGYAALAQNAVGYDTLTWVAGAMMYRLYENEEKASKTARPLPGTTQFYDVYNAAFMVDSRGNSDIYSKSKLVPGVERMPFANYLGPVGRLVEKLGGTGGSMGVQETRSVFRGADGTRIAPVICYESIYGAYLNEYIRKGAQLIFIITNDGWWKNTPGYRQHNQYARLRAIETRRSIARSAKTGISSFIDQKGEFISQTSWWEEVAIRSEMDKNDRLTYYVRNGDYLGKLSFFLSVLLILYLISQGIIRRKARPR
jgi:apolipoprotein N-acyltransferase